MKRKPTFKKFYELDNLYLVEFPPTKPPMNLTRKHISKITKLNPEDWQSFYNTISFGTIQDARVITLRTYPELLPLLKNSSVFLRTSLYGKNYGFIVDDFSIQNIVTASGPQYRPSEEYKLLYEHENLVEFVKEFTLFLTHKYGEKHLMEAIEYRKHILSGTEQALNYLKEHRQEVVDKYKSKTFKYDGDDIEAYVDYCTDLQENYARVNKELIAFMENVKANISTFFQSAQRKYVLPTKQTSNDDQQER